MIENNFNSNELIHEEAVFTAQDFSTLSLAEYSFFNCTFERCVFINTFLTEAKFYSCTFNACNISFVKVQNTLLQNVVFHECKLVGIEFYKANKTFFSITITNSNLLHCNFSDLSMKQTSFKESCLKECIFKNTQLEGANFTATDLQEAVFRNCNLNRANFSRAKNYSIDIANNKVKKAIFTYPDVMCLLKYFDIVIDYTQ